MLVETKFGNYELLQNEREAFDLAKFESKYLPEYFDKYQYLVGDLSDDILRLKGFSNDKKSPVYFHYIPEYLTESCSYNCRYYILKRVKADNHIDDSIYFSQLEENPELKPDNQPKENKPKQETKVDNKPKDNNQPKQDNKPKENKQAKQDNKPKENKQKFENKPKDNQPKQHNKPIEKNKDVVVVNEDKIEEMSEDMVKENKPNRHHSHNKKHYFKNRNNKRKPNKNT